VQHGYSVRIAALYDIQLGLIESHSLPKRWIRGNGDVDTVATADGTVPSRVPPPFHETMRWVARHLDAHRLAEMASWPLTETVDVEGIGQLLFCHATPRLASPREAVALSQFTGG